MIKNAVSLALFLSIIGLSGCDSVFPKAIHSEKRLYEITKVYRPKHFRLEVKDVVTGRPYRVSISKRCNSWRKAKIGSRWYFMEVTYQRGEDRYKGVKQIGNFCETLRKM